MKRIIMIAMVLLACAAGVFAQNVSEQKTSEVKRFTPQQREQLIALDNQKSIAEANRRAAQAEASLAQERINSILKDACHDAGVALDECALAPDGTGVLRIPKPAGTAAPSKIEPPKKP